MYQGIYDSTLLSVLILVLPVLMLVPSVLMPVYEAS